jgi:hypothetical protein
MTLLWKGVGAECGGGGAKLLGFTEEIPNEFVCETWGKGFKARGGVNRFSELDFDHSFCASSKS